MTTLTDVDSDRRLLLVSSAPQVRSAVTRVTAVLGLEATVVGGLADARSAWSTAAVVLVGADALAGADAAEPTRLPRRGGVAVVAAEAPAPVVLQRALGLGADRVLVLPADEPDLVALVADVLDGDGPPARTLAVVGGRGGAGATTLAVALAVSAARAGHVVTLVDADPLGGGVDLALGAEHVPGVRWPDLVRTTGRINAAALADSLPCVHGVRVLSWDRGPAIDVGGRTADAVLDASVRMCDVVVVDVPRHLDALSEAAVARAATVLLVVPAELRAVAAASRVAASVCRVGPTPGVVVRRSARGRLPGRVVAELLSLPYVGVVGDDPRVERALELGEPPGLGGHGPLPRLAASILATDIAAQVA